MIGVDHDPVVQEDTLIGRATCTDYVGRGFPYCYDEHHGTDYLLKGGFESMDAGSAPVTAAADGVVVEVADGHYDRCRATGDGTIDCDGNDGIANSVIVEHADGKWTMYWHLVSGSVAVQPGDPVRCGDVLGLVGSSGYSSGPHLHFQVTLDGAFVDPYAGPYSQAESGWSRPPVGDELPGTSCLPM